MTIAIQCKQMNKVVHGLNKKEMILAINDFVVNKGEQVVIMGPSGSGKTTLLHLLAGLDKPTKGTVHLLNEQVSSMSEKKRDQFRGSHIGIVFQEFQLFPYLTVIDNILVQNLVSRNTTTKETIEKANLLLEKLGLSHRSNVAVQLLSKGEQQRVAIARALVHQPEILLVDEPTSSLDVRKGMEVVSLLKELCDERGTTLILVTHDPTVASQFDRVENMDQLNEVYADQLNEVRQ